MRKLNFEMLFGLMVILLSQLMGSVVYKIGIFLYGQNLYIYTRVLTYISFTIIGIMFVLIGIHSENKK